MRYFLILHSPEARFETMDKPAMAALIGRYRDVRLAMDAAGVLVGAYRLRPTADATTVRMRDGETLVTDGPFAETKEQFGGVYVIDVASLDDALAWARRIPACEDGSVEVRPVWEMER